MLGLALISCSDGETAPDGGADGGTDSATDTDTDTDTDGDSDADAGEDGGTSHEAVDVSAGNVHTCAVIEGGDVKCWGFKQYGALGYGYDLDALPGADTSLPSTLPFVDVGAPVERIVASGKFTCALLESHDMLCWGTNDFGQLGQAAVDTIGVIDVPADYDPIALDGPVAQVSAGAAHACALLESGVLKCWGNNSDGQLGDGNGGTGHQSYTPVVAQVGGSVVQVSAGSYHTCAVLEGGNILCWGNSGAGELGYGNIENVGDDELPSDVGPVDLGGSAVQVSCGTYHTCALLESGDVVCWGLGEYGMLGNGNTETIGDNEVPADVGPVDVGAPVQQITLGAHHTCALLVGGDVKCWGQGVGGQLGYGNPENVGDDEVPADVGFVDIGAQVVAIDSGQGDTCVLTTTGTIRCWGVDDTGELGYGDLGSGVVYIGDDETPASMGDVPLF
ncbi:MAG: hypothetical protein M0R80_06265 [Proteobacteria bacterium]|nr:hypothetical protein [Pseudomonadota bacterium]